MPTIFRHKVFATPLYNGVEIESISFNDTFKPGGAQAWGLDVMDGWKTGGDVEESSVELGSYRDGVSSASFYPVRKRYVTLGGYAVHETEAGAEGLHDILVRDAFPRNRDIIIVRNEGVPKRVIGRRAAPIDIDWEAVPNGFRWQTTIMCEDPLKYGTVLNSASGGIAGALPGGHTFPVTFPMTFNSGSGGGFASIGANNIGNAYSPRVRATIKGYLGKGAWRLSNDTTGEYIGFNVAVQTSDILVIGMSSQTALLNGQPVSASYFGNYWKLAPGPNVIRLYAEYDANALATIEYRSAWE
jgi:hypothetical protein